MKILEAEVNLREETRVAEQARRAIADKEYKDERAGQLGQHAGQRFPSAWSISIERIRDLPDAEEDFGKEIALLDQRPSGDGRGDHESCADRIPARRPSRPRPRQSSCC